MTKNYQRIIANNIKKALKETSISQTQLAEMLNKSKAYVSNIIKGRYTPKLAELFKIAEYLKKPFSYFVGEADPELTLYAEKAEHWDKIMVLFNKYITQDLRDDCVTIPFFNLTTLYAQKITDIKKLHNAKSDVMHITASLVKAHFKYFKPVSDLFSIRLSDDFPPFGLVKGDIGVFEPIYQNDIKDNGGKMFLVHYKTQFGIKRLYLQGTEYYLEPMDSSPDIERVKISDENFSILGRLLFDVHFRFH